MLYFSKSGWTLPEMPTVAEFAWNRDALYVWATLFVVAILYSSLLVVGAKRVDEISSLESWKNWFAFVQRHGS